MNFIEQFAGNNNDPLIQFIKYALSGGVAMAVHILVFHITAWKVFPAFQESDFFVKLFKLSIPDQTDSVRSRNSMIDNFIAFIFSNLVAYIINILWVFTPGKHHWVIEISLFYLVTGVSMALGTALMGFLIKRFGLQTTIAFASNIVTAVMINYVMRKYFIFSG